MYAMPLLIAKRRRLRPFAPPWLVEQFGFLEEFIDEQTIVESVLAPFYSPVNDDSQLALLQIGKEVPILESYADFQPEASFNDTAYEPDFDSESYFYFISRHIEKFRKHFPTKS
jgi:hypothetical protein